MGQAKIAILVNSRVQGNSNSNLKGLLQSLEMNTACPDNIEVHVKYDDDDSSAQEIVTTKFPTNYDFGPRGRGYIDIHNGYNQLMRQISPSVELVGAMADDFLVEPGWDNALMEIMIKKEPTDIYLIHQRPHPPSERADYLTNTFSLGAFPIIDKMEDLFIVDEAPFWSRELLDISIWLGAGLSFTDGWTIALEYVLWQTFKTRITEFTDKCYIKRVLGENDYQNSLRWNTDRKINFEYVKSDYFKNMVTRQATNIYRALKAKHG